jgi:hypothetical protein
MTSNEIQLSRYRAERIIAQVLRDDHGVKPAEANTAAASICNRLLCSMPIHAGYPMSNGGHDDLGRSFR